MKTQWGYTLIEILIVAAVMGLVLVGGVASYSSFQKRQLLVQTANDLVSELRGVQKEANNGINSDQCADGLVGYRVNFSGQVMAVTLVCEGFEDEEGALVESKSLKALITNVNPPNYQLTDRLLFNTVSGSVVNPKTITLGLANSSETISVVVTTGGAINVGD